MAGDQRFSPLALVALVSCHSPCASDAPPEILGGVSVVVTATTATLTWSTDEESTSYVDYGPGDGYGLSDMDERLVLEHSSHLVNLAPGTRYGFRVRSRDECGNEAASDGQTFTTSSGDLVPTPVLVDEPDQVGPVPRVVLLEWGGVTAPGGAAEYAVEVDDDETFVSVDHSSGWISGTDFELSAGGGWFFWRVRARDAADTSLVSGWSLVDAFQVSSSRAPPAPRLVDEPNVMSGGMSYPVTLEWTPVADPDGDPVQYLGQLAYSPVFEPVMYESGWVDGPSWTVTLPPGSMWYWRVKARDASHVDSQSRWSEVDDFYDMTMPGSCPFLFAWDGDGYRYLTDIQGPAIGLPSSVLTIRNMRHYRPEYVVLDRVEEKEGKLEVKIRETQDEITYLDEARLLVVDCKGGGGVVSSTAESTYSYGYADPFRVIPVGADPLAPVDARNPAGASVLEELLEVDGRVAGREARYVVDFGEVPDTGRAILLIDGWSVYDRDRYPQRTLVQPFIEVRDGKGRWVRARGFGNPAGDMKRMAVDLSGLLGPGEGLVRINMGKVHAVRWVMDRIALDVSGPDSCETRVVEASRALLYHGGRVPYARANLDHPNLAWDECLPDNVEAYGFGSFTRYGDVLALLGESDDMYAILRHGDEVLVSFPGLGPPSDGTTRSFILMARLWYKHLSIVDTVEPLPYIGMTSYPAAGYPGGEAHRAYLEKYNVRRYIRSVQGEPLR